MVSTFSGKIIFIMGTTGAGKGTLISMFRNNHPELLYPISVTTRPKRENEIDGENYHFISQIEFDKMIENDELLEYALVHNKGYYGTSKKVILDGLKNGKKMIRELDYQGLIQIKDLLPRENYKSIFIMPPSFDILKKRIQERAKISDEEVEKRIESAKVELTHLDLYDIKLEVIDGDIEKSYELFESEILRK